MTRRETAFDKKLSDKVRSIVARRVPAQAVEEVAQEVLMALHRWSERTGAKEREELEKGSHIITRRVAGRWHRNTRREAEDNAGATDLADEYAHEIDPGALDRVDVERVLAEIVKLLRAHGVASGDADEMGRRLVDLILELTPEEIAEITGKSYEASKKESQRTLAKLVAHFARLGLHDIGLPRLLAAGTAVAMLLFLFVPRENRRLVQETITSLIHPRRPLDTAPRDLPPGPNADQDLLDDAEDAVKKGNFERCNMDLGIARFHGRADQVRLREISRKCQELGDRIAPPPPPPRPSASSSPAPKAPSPRPAPRPQLAPDELRSLQPLH